MELNIRFNLVFKTNILSFITAFFKLKNYSNVV